MQWCYRSDRNDRSLPLKKHLYIQQAQEPQSENPCLCQSLWCKPRQPLQRDSESLDSAAWGLLSENLSICAPICERTAGSAQDPEFNLYHTEALIRVRSRLLCFGTRIGWHLCALKYGTQRGMLRCLLDGVHQLTAATDGRCLYALAELELMSVYCQSAECHLMAWHCVSL